MAWALGWLGSLAVRRPRLVLLATSFPALVATLLVLRVPFDLSFTGVLDRADPRVDAYYSLGDELNFAGRMPLLLEGPEEVLDEAAAATVALEELPSIDRVLANPPQDWFRQNAPWLVPDDVFAAWMDAAESGRPPQDVEELEQQLQPVQGARLVLVLLKDDPMDANLGEIGFEDVELRAAELMEPFGVTAGFAGVAAVADQDQRQVMQRVRILTPVSLLIVLLLLTVVERRPLHLLAVAVPMVMASGSTLGIVGTLLGTITFMETFYGVMIFGLGVDFALHLAVRVREEAAISGDFETAVRQAWSTSGPGVVVGGMTTAGAFFMVGMADDPTARHLGWSGFVGLGSCLLLMLTWLPAAWTLLGGVGPARPPLRVPGLHRVASAAASRPRMTLVVAAGVLLVTGAGLSRYHYETDLAKVFSRDVPALVVADRVQQLYGVNPGPWVLRAADVEQARAWSDELEADPLFERVDSVADLLRPANVLEARWERLRTSREALQSRLARQHSLLVFAGPKVEQVHRSIELLDLLLQAEQAGPPTLDTLHPWLREQLLAPDGRPVLLAYSAMPTMDGSVAAIERQRVQQLDPAAAGIGISIEVTMEGDRPWLIPVWCAIFVYVTLLLTWDLRRPRLMAAALAPVVLGLVVTFGTLCWLGYSFNVMTLVVLPLIVGLGVDDGVHVVHRIREGSLDPADAAARVGGAIVMTTATTCSSFLLLLTFAGHVGLEGMARVLLIGLPVCLVASITVVPALLATRSVRTSPAAPGPASTTSPPA